MKARHDAEESREAVGCAHKQVAASTPPPSPGGSRPLSVEVEQQEDAPAAVPEPPPSPCGSVSLPEGAYVRDDYENPAGVPPPCIPLKLASSKTSVMRICGNSSHGMPCEECWTQEETWGS